MFSAFAEFRNNKETTSSEGPYWRKRKIFLFSQLCFRTMVGSVCV